MDNYGIISLLPVLVVIITAIITKRALEPLIVGALVGFIILDGVGFMVGYLGALMFELGNSAYFILVFGFFGIFIKLLEDSNAISGFTKVGMKFASNKKKSGVLTWVIGMVAFLDNYFSILAAGVTNREIADNNKISREMFAFSVNSVACVTCVLVPLSLWGIFMAGPIESALGLEAGEGIAVVAKSIPYMFFAFVLGIFVLLYNLRIVPIFGPMKKAEQRAEETGQTIPDLEYAHATAEETEEPKKVGNILNFLVPMIAVIAVTLFTSELMYGLIVGIVFCLVLYVAQKLISFGDALGAIPQGFMDMFVVTALVISAFVLQQANTELGLAPFVVEAVEPYMSEALLPAIAFLLLGVLGFVTGSFWGMMAVCFPIIIPLADAVGTDIYLAIGAVISGAALGSSTCFYGDSITLSCGVTKIKNIDYLRAGVPLVIPPMIITLILYVIAGFIFA